MAMSFIPLTVLLGAAILLALASVFLPLPLPFLGVGFGLLGG